MIVISSLKTLFWSVLILLICFPVWINGSSLEAVTEILENRETNFPPAECILDALKLCLECNNLYLMRNFFTGRWHCSIAMYRFDLKALTYTPKVLWKRFRDDIFAVWNHSLQELHKFFGFMNSIDTSGKTKFTISIANNNSVLEVLDLSLHINKNNKICVDVYAKPTNSFTYVFPSTCCPKKKINKILKETAL